MMFARLLLAVTILGAAAQGQNPNIVFILADDLGWHQLGAYGSRFYETPHLDRLAREGMKFTNAYAAAPVCSPTRASIVTG
ncbi:MAG: sulfatase-like hydrolase/transferase, partial [bacterium]|nr:sulfatase-like hydrolase/transferase [bacterium]